ncbi:MAG: hypothetical protein QM699_11630 [Amaricoccus sp.]|uniref:hypothetical protein n=1 Tax=Amaricoccus sp. TaxID=1872485 RepID=UPI0039E3F5BC
MSKDSRPLPLARTPALLRDFADVMLPGDGDWPSGGTLGVQHPLAGRLAERYGDGALPRLVEALVAAGAPFDGLAPDARALVVATFEAAEPAFFGQIRDILYLAYYEHPLVVALIDASGRPYRLRPHLSGYDLPAFDRARDYPRHNRGHYVPTDAIRPVDPAPLELDTRITTAWGVNR